MMGKLLTEHHFESLSLEGRFIGSSEYTHVKMSNCWKSHALAQDLEIYKYNCYSNYTLTFAYHSTMCFDILS